MCFPTRTARQNTVYFHVFCMDREIQVYIERPFKKVKNLTEDSANKLI